MLCQFNSWLRLALASLLLISLTPLGATAQGTGLTATLQTNKGCGRDATFANGEPITVSYSVSDNANVTITLTRPDGRVSRPVFNQFVPAGATRSFTGVVGGFAGVRQLLLNATSTTTGATAQVECLYWGQEAPAPGPFTATVQTDRGCGSSAVYNLGESISIQVNVSRDAVVTLRLRHPDGSLRTLLFGEPIPAGGTRSLFGIIGNPVGTRTLILDASSGTQTAHAECAYTASGTIPPPAPSLTLSVDRGCGATYRVGEQILITYRATGANFPVLTLLFQDPLGNTRTIFANQTVLGGQTYVLRGVIGLPTGTRRLILQSSSGAQVTCQFTGLQ